MWASKHHSTPPEKQAKHLPTRFFVDSCFCFVFAFVFSHSTHSHTQHTKTHWNTFFPFGFCFFPHFNGFRQQAFVNGRLNKHDMDFRGANNEEWNNRRKRPCLQMSHLYKIIQAQNKNRAVNASACVRACIGEMQTKCFFVRLPCVWIQMSISRALIRWIVIYIFMCSRCWPLEIMAIFFCTWLWKIQHLILCM